MNISVIINTIVISVFEYLNEDLKPLDVAWRHFPQRNTVYGGIFESMLIETFGGSSIFNEIAISFLN